MSNQQLEADYLIIGGGTAGLVLANRLSEDGLTNVLVLEAGDDHTSDPMVTTPALWPMLQKNPSYDWCLNSVPQKALVDRMMELPQGRMLGGSSGLNGQTMSAPSSAVFDAWEALGNKEWGWSSLKSYWQKFYTIHVPDSSFMQELSLDQLDLDIHGRDGPIKATFQTEPEPYHRAWIETFKALGWNQAGDAYSGSWCGGYANLCGINPVTKTRSWAASEYGLKAKAWSNCKFLTGATVHKILFEQAQATGVDFEQQGRSMRATARKEVILAAGGYQSAKILELSGIGSARILESLGIKTIFDNKNVGENLQDHLMTGISYEVRDGLSTKTALLRQDPDYIAAAQKAYVETQSGPFTTGGIGAHGFLSHHIFTPVDQEWVTKAIESLDRSSAPTEQHAILKDLVQSPLEGSSNYFLFPILGNVHDADIYKPQLDGEFITIGVYESHPFSRGSSHISSARIADPLIIDHNYFGDNIDLEIMARHLLNSVRIATSEPMASLLKQDGRRNHPDAFIKNIDDAKRYLIDTVRTCYHGCGTCAMLPQERNGVVDDRLRVYGTERLRVVDSSIFPIIPRGNIMTSVYAVAEKAADIIKHDNRSVPIVAQINLRI